MNSEPDNSVGPSATRGPGDASHPPTVSQSDTSDNATSSQRVQQPGQVSASVADLIEAGHEAGAEASTSAVPSPTLQDQSVAAQKEQLDAWAKSLRHALRANNRHQDSSQALAQQIEDSLARLHDLEHLSRSLVEEMRQPRNVNIDPEQDAELHQISQPWLKYFHDLELPRHEDSERFRRFQMHTRPIQWSRDELKVLKAEVQMEVAKLKAMDAAKSRSTVDQLEDWPLAVESERVDWDKVAGHKLLAFHGPEGCRLRWLNHEHESLAQGSWSKAETTRLQEIARQHNERDWVAIASELGTQRTPAACLSQYRKQSNDKKDWTEEQDRDLRDGIILFGTNWQSVARYVGRNGDQCISRWYKSLHSEIKRSRWTPEEDQTLLRSVEYIKKLDGGPTVAWKKVATRVQGRTDAQCRERYANQLDPNVKKDNVPWTAEEDADVLRLHEQHGPKWATISKAMDGTRTDNSIFRRYEELQRRAKKDDPPEEADGFADLASTSRKPPRNKTTHANKSAAGRSEGGKKTSQKRKSATSTAPVNKRARPSDSKEEQAATMDGPEQPLHSESAPGALSEADGQQPTQSGRRPRPPPKLRPPPAARKPRKRGKATEPATEEQQEGGALGAS